MCKAKAHPLLFKTEMVRAILERRKTMTRRVVTQHNSLIDGTGEGIRAHWPRLEWDKAWVAGQREDPLGQYGTHWLVPCPCMGDNPIICHRITPRVQVGDEIWVKETWRAVMEAYRTFVEYKAGPPDLPADRDVAADNLKRMSLRFPGARKDRHSDAWRSPLHMPRWAARIVRPVIRVGAERVQEISGADVWAEGLECRDGWPPPDLETWFRDLWDGINGKKPGRAWADNPPTWSYEWGPAGKA